jgi:hypothetical protein
LPVTGLRLNRNRRYLLSLAAVTRPASCIGDSMTKISNPVHAVCYPLRLVVLDDGTECPITNLFDAEGDETDDIDEATAAVAKIDDDNWLSIDLTQFDPVVVH